MRCNIHGAFGELIRQTIAHTRNARNRDPGEPRSVRSNLSGCSCRDCAAIIAYECVQPRASREQPRFVSRKFRRVIAFAELDFHEVDEFPRSMKTSARVWPNYVRVSRELDHETAENISALAKNMTMGKSKVN